MTHNNILNLSFDNTYSVLPPEFYHEVSPTPFKNPFIAAFNEDVAGLLGVDSSLRDHPDIADYFCGAKQIPGSRPVAMYYTGHQFGVYNPHIGDGRAILLGEVRNGRGEKYDLHLKGSGRTKFSRQFDGRAVLRSTIREYLCSEAMHHLGIPTTRALCIIGSDEKVEREKTEPGAMMIRTAETHLRFGSFESFYYDRDYDNLKTLADYTIDHLYPEIVKSENKYKNLLIKVAEKTAELIAGWQALGFTHGVMNTDNMSIAGLTIDYGPFGFMEKFSRDYIPNHSDHFGRYSYKNQPSIGFWNLEKLVKAMQPLISGEDGKEALETYRSIYFESYYNLMFEKLGFKNSENHDRGFVDDTLNLIENYGLDYTVYFRKLSNFNLSITSDKYLKELSVTSGELSEWFDTYASKIEKEKTYDSERKTSMDSVNPKYIPRNYICEQVIREAEDNHNYGEIDRVRKILSKPFDEQPQHQEYAKEPPEWAQNLIISCSS